MSPLMDIVWSVLALVFGIWMFRVHLKFWRDPEVLRRHWLYHAILLRARVFAPRLPTFDLTAGEIRTYAVRSMVASLLIIALSVVYIIATVARAL